MNTVEPEYQAALDYLYSYVDFSMQKSMRYSPEQFDLGRMVDFVQALGEPHRKYPLIHVAGTKGKGSVSALCASALQAGGYKVGLYTSPHLEDYAERIQVNGVPIPHADLVALLDEIKPVVESIPRLTTFEITTGLAFLYFYRQGCTAVVAEVGLGGRLDATNVVLPKVSVITSLSYDHTSLLGETLAEIAAEKAGIIKPQVPVVLAPQKEEARLVVARIAEERSSRLVQIGQDYLYSSLVHSLDGQTFMVWARPDASLVDRLIASGDDSSWKPVQLTIPLLGSHQVENAATAYAALRTADQVGLVLGEQAIQAGFSQVTWLARFEILRRQPPVVVDSAHNRDSALKLRLAIEEYFPGYPLVLVFGASEDKDVRGMLTELLPVVGLVIAVKSFHPRAMDPDLVVNLAQELGRPARVIPEVVDGFQFALDLAGEAALVLVTGSIFVAAGARSAWEKGLLRL